MSHIHANTAAVGQLHSAAAEVMRGELTKLANPEFYRRSYRDLADRVEASRSEIAGLLGVPPTTVALTSSTSDGIAMFQSALPLVLGDVIAVSRGSFISVPASLLRLQIDGIKVFPVGTEAGMLQPQDLSATPDRTRLVVVDWVNYWSGVRNDLQPLVRWCRQANIPLLVDGVQGVGAVPIDFDIEGVAGLACGGHKWLRGPEGTGFLYVAEWMGSRLTPRHNGYRSLSDPLALDAQRLELSIDARVFEVGTVNTLGFAGLGAAIHHSRTFGTARLTRRIRETHDALHRLLRETSDVEVITPEESGRRAGILSFRHRDFASKDILRRLDDAGIIAGSRRGLVRLSPAADVDVAELLQRVGKALKLLKRRLIPLTSGNGGTT